MIWSLHSACKFKLEKEKYGRLHFSITHPTQYRLSKVITFAPRYIVKNNMANEIQFRVNGDSRFNNVPSKSTLPAYSVSSGGDLLMSIRQIVKFDDWYEVSSKCG